MERTTGVEPASEAWEAAVLPMNYVRKAVLALFTLSHRLSIRHTRVLVSLAFTSFRFNSRASHLG